MNCKTKSLVFLPRDATQSAVFYATVCRL